MESLSEEFEKACNTLDKLINEYVKVSNTKLNEDLIKFKRKIINKIKSWSNSCIWRKMIKKEIICQ